MSTINEAYERGLQLGREAQPTVRAAWTDNIMEWARNSYPASRELDYWAEIIKLDKERMDNPPDSIKYPETKGLPDEMRAERKGFQEGCGGGERELAYHYTWYYFVSCRLNTRYVGYNQRANNCTAVYIRDNKEGGGLYGRNLDDVRRPAELEDFSPPQEGPDGKPQLLVSGVSSAVLCDEEPDEIFPVNPWKLMGPDCKRVDDILDFLMRYRMFWGPQNGILVDEYRDCAAYEKSNCRMGIRKTDDGTAAVTACSYLIPEMRAFKEKCSRKSLELRGWGEDSLDWRYWTGCDQRYERLLKLTDEANRRGATLDDMVNVVMDRAVPFPDCVCLAGENPPSDKLDGNWTLYSFASVLDGPNRRTKYHRVEGQTPCFETVPFLIPGCGVEVKPEWTVGTRSVTA